MALNSNDQAASLRNRGAAYNLNLQSKKKVCCIAIASGKGGVGKTFISVNLAIAFVALKKKVLLVDVDLGLANADIVLGVNPQYSLQDAVFKGKELRDIVVATTYGVDLLAASSGSREMVSLGAARMEMFIKELISFSSEYDVIIFDCAAGIDNNVMSFLDATPFSLIVMTAQPTSIMDVYALIKLANQGNMQAELGIIVNMVRDDKQGAGVVKTLNTVTERFLSLTVNSIGIIPNSENVVRSIQQRKPLITIDEDDPVSRRIREITRKLLQKQSGITKVNDLDGSKLLNGLLGANKGGECIQR